MSIIIATLACLYCFGLGWVIGLAANLRHDDWDELPQRDMVPRGTELQEWRWQ